MKHFDLNATKKMHSDILLETGILKNLDASGLLSLMRKTSRHILITDENVERLYLKQIVQYFDKKGLSILSVVVPASEQSKSLNQYAEVVQKVLDYSFDKYSFIISLGGGVVNNLAGFLASTLYRGIGLVHIPTSLLAQVDAAIDFKQAVNHSFGKNLIGSYYPASKIIIDPSVLLTLDIRFIRDGLAESIKHAICQDIAFYSFLHSNVERLMDLDVLYKIVHRSIELKLMLMNDDLDNDYDETIKQYGHAVGHAIEHLSDGEIYHGEAISIGMCVTSEIAVLLGLSDKKTLDLHYDIFQYIGLPTQVPFDYTPEQIWNKMRYDKHSLDGKIYTGLVRAIGLMAETQTSEFGHYIDENTLKEAVKRNQKRISND